MYLHEAIVAVLEATPGRCAHRGDIAKAVENSGLYRMRDGGTASSDQVSARVAKHPSLFALHGNGVIGLR